MLPDENLTDEPNHLIIVIIIGIGRFSLYVLEALFSLWMLHLLIPE